jgi:DNA-binding transcriptional regulator YdaS (Cro superfamily)
MDIHDIKRAVDYAGSQRGLARLIGVNERTVRRWVAGQISPARLATAAIRRVLIMAVDR